MFNVTMAARARLARKLAHKKAAPEMALRFVRRTGGWSLRVDQRTPVDVMFDYKGSAVLVLDEAVSNAMSDRVLDVTKTESGSRLVLKGDDSRPDRQSHDLAL